MVQQIRRGIVRSVKIFDSNNKGEIVLRTSVNPIEDITLKLSNDHESAFSTMATVVCVAVQFGDAAKPQQAPNLHVKYDDNDMEIDELEFHWN
jgi:hypothetical protein